MKLDQYLKWQGLAATGGEAKQRIRRGDVRVNGLIETRRGRQLATGDAVAIDGVERIVLPLSPAPPAPAPAGETPGRSDGRASASQRVTRRND